MTYEEALNTLEEKYIGIGSNDLFVFRKAAEAINKQIPKKVVREAGKILYSCPNNRLHQMTVDKKGEFRYCSICGQALDWSDVK